VDKTLPASLPAERAILGGILLDNDSMPAHLCPDHFYGEAHRIIFAAMTSLKEQGTPIDCLTLGEQLSEGELKRAGGLGYFSALSDGLPREPNVSQYAVIVMEKARLRDVISSANTIVTSAMNGAADLDQHVETLSIHYRERVRLERNDTLKWRTAADDINTSEQPDFIVKDYLPRAAVIELSGPPKTAGKTTFVTHMCDAITRGKPFLGRPTKKGPIVYLSEETPTTFRQALRRAGVEGCEDLHILHKNNTIGMTFSNIMLEAVSRAQEVGAGVIVVDTAPAWMGLKGEEENQSGPVLEAMSHLQNAAAQGFAVLPIRHDRKSGGSVGTSARGSSAYTGAADIVLQLRRPQNGTRRSVRELHAVSRFDDTPELLLIELTAEGYVAHGSATAVALDDAKKAIERTAPASEADAKRLDDILADIDVNVSGATGQRAADELLKEGVLGKVGNCVRGNPFKFFLIKHRLLV